MKNTIPASRPENPEVRPVPCKSSDSEFDFGRRRYAGNTSPTQQWRSENLETDRSFRLDVLRAVGLIGPPRGPPRRFEATRHVPVRPPRQSRAASNVPVQPTRTRRAVEHVRGSAGLMRRRLPRAPEREEPGRNRPEHVPVREFVT